MDFSTTGLFSTLSNAELVEVQKIASRQHMSRGEIVFNEGDYEKNIYIIESGQVEIFKKHPIHGEQSISVLKNGDYFGEMAFFEKNASRSASSRTLQSTVLIVIKGSDFEKLLHNHPSISLKLLATLSQRLRDTNKLVSESKQAILKKECKVLTVASAKDGYGKTTFSVSLAKLLSSELPHKVLFFDLDLYFGSGTHLMGIHSPRSIIDIASKIRASESSFEIMNETIRMGDNLWGIPAPRSFLEAEQIHSSDILAILKIARKHFDYIVIDTGSIFDENLFTVLDTADFIFFLINFANLSTITDNVRFFHGVSKLSYPKERLILLGSNIGPDFSSSKTSKIFPYPVIGGLPRLGDYQPQFGKPPYDLNNSSPYCEVLRLLVRNILEEKTLKRPTAKSTIFSTFFGGKESGPDADFKLSQFDGANGIKFAPIINPNDVRSQVKYVRYNMIFGYIKEAKENLMTFLEYSQAAAPLFELLGEIYLREDNPAEALEAFSKAVSLDPTQHLALGYLGILTNKNDQYLKAIEIANNKIAANPSHLDLINDLGKILMKNENYEEALNHFQRALKSNPNYLEAKMNLAVCLSSLNKSDEAIELLLSISNKNPRIYCTLGNIFYDTNRFYLAHKAYSKSMEIYGGCKITRTRLLELTNYLRKLDSVIDIHEKFVNTNPNFPDLHAKLASFYHQAGKSEIAIEEYKKAIALNQGYRDATSKLEMIQKDMIWRLAKTHLVEAVETHNAVTKDLQVDLSFSMINTKNKKLPEETILQVKNVRTSKSMQKVMTNKDIETGTMTVDCSPLGLIACQDIILIQIINGKTKKALRFSPHYMELDEIKAGKFEINLEIDPNAAQATEDVVFSKYFLIHLTSKQFAEIISTENSMYKAFLKNLSNGLEAQGYLNPENDEQINFVLNGSNGSKGDSSLEKAAVKSGDKLEINIQDADKQDVFSMEFAIGNSDVKNFCKTIIPKDIS